MDRVAFLGGDQAHLGEHCRVRLAPGNIKQRETVIKGYRFAKLHHQLGGARCEASTPSGL